MELMELRGHKRQATRRNILDAAFDLFDRDGFEATTVEMIAAEAGVSARTVYRHFASKDLIVFAEFEGEPERFAAKLRLHCADAVTLATVLRAVAAQLGERQHDRWFPTLTALIRDNPALADRADLWRRDVAGHLASELALLDGVEQIGLDHTVMASTGMTLGGIAVATWARDSHEQDLEEMVHAVGRLLVNAVDG